MAMVHNAIMIDDVMAVNDNAAWVQPSHEFLVAAGSDRSERPVASEVWESLMVVILLLVAVRCSFDAFGLLKMVAPSISPEGAAAGWWLSMSVIWLAASRGGVETAPSLFGRPFGNRALRLYVALVFALFSGLQVGQHGADAIAGLAVGALSFLTVFLMATVCPK